MDAVGHRYGKRPSELWGIDDPGSHLLALAFDSEVLQKANAFESRRLEEIRNGGGSAGAELEKKRTSYLMWSRIAETAAEGSDMKRIATETAARLEKEVTG